MNFSLSTVLSTVLVWTLLTTNSYSAQWKKKPGKRKISSQDLIGQISSKDQKITAKLNAIINEVKPFKNTDGSPDYAKTATAVGKAIKKIVNVANENPNSDIAQLYKAAAEHIPHFRGVIYRLRKIVEVSDMAYLSAIWALKQFKQTSHFRAPYMEALFDLATMPNPEETILGQKGMFSNVSELQDWMTNKMAPKFQTTLSKIKAIAYKTGSSTHPIGMIKAELLVGDVIAQKYVPAKHAHKEWLLTSGHVIGLVSALENYMGLLYYTSAYNLEKLAEISNILTKETFISVKGASSRSKIFSNKSKRVELLSTKRIYQLTADNEGKNLYGKFGKYAGGSRNRNSAKYVNNKRFLTIRHTALNTPTGTNFPNYLKAAEHYFTNAAKSQLQYHIAMMDTFGMSNEDKLVINPDTYKATLDATPYIDQETVLRNSINVLEANGPYVLKDYFLDKEYTVDVSTLFDVKKVQDLRKFLPNKFNDSLKEKNPETPKGLNWAVIPGSTNRIETWKKNYSWNYSYNQALGWKKPDFGGLFPNMSAERKGDKMNLHLTNISSLPEIPYVGLWLSMFYGY